MCTGCAPGVHRRCACGVTGGRWPQGRAPCRPASEVRPVDAPAGRRPETQAAGRGCRSARVGREGTRPPGVRWISERSGGPFALRTPEAQAKGRGARTRPPWGGRARAGSSWAIRGVGSSRYICLRVRRCLTGLPFAELISEAIAARRFLVPVYVSSKTHSRISNTSSRSSASRRLRFAWLPAFPIHFTASSNSAGSELMDENSLKRLSRVSGRSLPSFPFLVDGILMSSIRSSTEIRSLLAQASLSNQYSENAALRTSWISSGVFSETAMIIGAGSKPVGTR